MPTKIAGRVFPAGTSRRVEATLAVSNDTAIATDASGHELARSRLTHLQIEAPIGSAPRRLLFHDGSLFESDDHRGVAQLESVSAGTILHRYEAFGPRLFAVVLMSALGVFLIWRFALPALVWVAVWMTPPALERAIDAGTMRTIDLTMASPTSLAADDREDATALFDRLLAELPEGTRDDFGFNLQFRSVPGMGPNAFALPGGTIVLTDALVRQFDDPDVIGGILGHEIGHVVESHGLQQLYRSLGIYVLVALIAGDTGPILEDILLEGNVLLSLAHSRQHERAADDFGLHLADAAGLDPEGLLRFFEAIPDTGDTSWLSTHPGNAERREAIREYLRHH